MMGYIFDKDVIGYQFGDAEHGEVWVDGKKIGEVTNLDWSIKLEPVVLPEFHIQRPAPMPITFSTTIVIPRIRWWTKLWCSLYWGHRLVRCSGAHGDFMWDYLRCRCGKVARPREEVVDKLGGIGSGPLGLSLRR